LKLPALKPAQTLLLSFSVVILAGAVLLAMPWASRGDPLSWVDALFTATSATCVTGLIVVDTGSKLSTFGQGTVLALIQLGGLGIMTFSSIFLVLLGKRLSFRNQDVLSSTLGNTRRSSITAMVRNVFIFTLTIEAVGALFLSLGFSSHMPFEQALYSGIFHSVSAFCNAGFSLYSDSFIHYRGDFIINVTIMFLIVLGGIGFLVLQDMLKAWTRRRKGKTVRLTLHTEVVLSTTAILIIGGAIGIWLFERNNTLEQLPVGEQVMASFFQSITARTAGFNTLDYSMLTNTSLFLTMILMFIGASPGSCGGGVKTSTVAIVASMFRGGLKSRHTVNIFQRTIPERTISKALAIIMLSFVFVTIMTFLLMAAEVSSVPHRGGGGTFMELFFEVMSAFGTVGLSTGITSNLSPVGKIIIVFTMLAGRLGPLTLAMALGPGEKKGRFQYAEENVVVG